MDEMPIDWAGEAIIGRRDRYYAASQRSFMPYRKPLIFRRGSMQYLWDEGGKQYTDLLGMNVCISVGHAHPGVTAAVQAQMAELQHCTTMFYHPMPAHFAEEFSARMPAGQMCLTLDDLPQIEDALECCFQDLRRRA
jgi:alanine-glyoxylate transaminase / (R)-3-amino-2-methylpropionate-pyruvate transaminase